MYQPPDCAWLKVTSSSSRAWTSSTKLKRPAAVCVPLAACTARVRARSKTWIVLVSVLSATLAADWAIPRLVRICVFRSSAERRRSKSLTTSGLSEAWVTRLPEVICCWASATRCCARSISLRNSCDWASRLVIIGSPQNVERILGQLIEHGDDARVGLIRALKFNQDHGFFIEIHAGQLLALILGLSDQRLLNLGTVLGGLQLASDTRGHAAVELAVTDASDPIGIIGRHR